LLVIPAQAGILIATLDSRLRGNDETPRFKFDRAPERISKQEPAPAHLQILQENTASVGSDCTHRITNDVAEGLNSEIMSTTRSVLGFTNRQNFTTGIFFCDGLSINPQ
jgi:transposase